MEHPKVDGPLLPNNVLDGAQRLLEDQVFGPEGLATRGTNELFMSTVGGHIMKLSGKNMDKLEKVVTIGVPCGEMQQLMWFSPCHNFNFGTPTRPPSPPVPIFAYVGNEFSECGSEYAFEKQDSEVNNREYYGRIEK